MSRCQICHQRDGDHRLDIASESGVSPVNVCPSCFEWAEDKIGTSRAGICIACRAEGAGKYEITEYGAPGVTAAICNDCRRCVLLDNRPLREDLAESGVLNE
jgi:hypothetical protein